MSVPTVKRSGLAGWAGYGYCASHSRFDWGLKLYLVCTPSGMPILWALANPKIGEREVLATMLEVESDVVDSTTPSKGNSTSNGTAAAPSRAWPCAWPSVCSPWPPRSGTTTAPDPRSADR